MKVINIFSNYTPDLLLQLANKAIKIKTLNAEALKSYIKLEWSNPIGREKPAITKKQWTTWSEVVRVSLSSAMFSPMKMFGFSNRMFSSSSIQSRHFFHMSGYRGASGWISNNPHKRRYCGGCCFNSYLHEGCQVGVVVVQGGDDVELYFHRDSLAQVVLSGDICQSVQQFDLGGPVGERREK